MPGCFPARKIRRVFVFFVIVTGFTGSGFIASSGDNGTHSAYLTSQNKTLVATIDKCLLLCDKPINAVSRKQLQKQYFLTRVAYKHIECYLEYCSPFDVKYFINGPLVKKSEPEIGRRIVDPHGFQVIEEQLFGIDTIDVAVLKTEFGILKDAFTTFEKKLPNLTISHAQVLEMMQFELVRMCGLSLSGYDATFTKTNIQECAAVFSGFESFLTEIKNGSPNDYPLNTHQALLDELIKARAYCLAHKEYNQFNRLEFITKHIKPLYKQLVTLHKHELFPFTPVNYALDLKNENLFNAQTFNLSYFSIKTDDTTGNALQARLGEFLFFDPILSGNMQRSCASCHKPNLAFCDGLQKATEFEQQGQLSRNTPGLLNVILQRQFFYDGRARQPEQQINDVLHNKKEMNISIDEMISRLNESDEYKALFANAYRGTADTIISYYGVLKAITEYEKTLISLNSRFDQYLNGNYTTLNQQEINGYNLFSGKALCGSCHFFPLFNGLVPPVFNDTEYEVIGVPDKPESKTIDPDEGRMNVYGISIHQYAFKTPTVRNVQLTAPYMHNGIYKTLDEVIEFYNKGGGVGLGISIPHQTLPFDSLRLNKQEISDLKAFMLSLTDTSGLQKKPVRLPSFKNENFNKRIIGGVY